ncbi:MAG: hypothetical protein M1381_04080 [Deltaproteobacteria bacterium]|nr:hypothetical protein [Deltaproteobacteria bacterium]MCL5792784.1 hypothetical protein [Deltaproteobacteria bacterium]
MKQTHFGVFNKKRIGELALKLLSSRPVQPVMSKTFEAAMKLKQGFDSVMPAVLSILNLPSVSDVRRLNEEVVKLGNKLDHLIAQTRSKDKKEQDHLPKNEDSETASPQKRVN